LAGEAHLDSTLPLVVDKLMEDGGDILNEECATALTRLGTPAVLHAIAEKFPSANRHFHLYATEPLEQIHSDLSVETCLRLLGQEEDEMIQGSLAHALLYQFATEGIEATRQLLLGRQELDFEGRGLRDDLLETCTFMGERFPECDEWLAASRAEKEAHWKRVKELEGDPRGLLLYALEKLAGKRASDKPRAKPPLPPMPRPTPPHQPVTKPPLPSTPRLTLPRQAAAKQKVGRNDPCPCGSGKKFKKCCGRNSP
jgi:hypothetical protein